MSFLQNRKGFSLLEITIAMGLASGLLIFYMKMQGEQAKQALTAKVNQEIETFFTDFKATLNRPGFCNKSFDNTFLTDKSEVKIESIKSPRGDIRYASGTKYGSNNFTLKTIILKDFKPDDHDGLEGIATLQLGLEKAKNIYGAKAIFKTMEISVSRNQSGKIIACGSLGSGGINIQITSPAPTSNHPPTTNSTTDPTPSTETPNTTISPQPSSNSDEKILSQQELMKEIEKSPEFKKIQESLMKLQEQQAEGQEVEDAE